MTFLTMRRLRKWAGVLLGFFMSEWQLLKATMYHGVEIPRKVLTGPLGKLYPPQPHGTGVRVRG